MARSRPTLTEDDVTFVQAQPMFFVATAPRADDGHVNLSPKGHDTFRVLAPDRVAYLDFNGSGVETIAHLRENGRITFMFCAFTGSPKILRIYGRGLVHRGPELGGLAHHFEGLGPARAVIDVTISRVMTSCGYGVPRMSFDAERDQMQKWAAKKGPEGIVRYQGEKNAHSLDGLPGLEGLDPD